MSTPDRRIRRIIPVAVLFIFTLFGLPSFSLASSFVFATSLCDSSEEPGVTVLLESLLAHGHREHLVIVVSASIPPSVSARLEELPLARVYVAPRSPCNIASDDPCQHLRLELFRIPHSPTVTRIIYLSPNVVVARGLGSLVNQPAFSAARAPHLPYRDHSVMVLAPDQNVYSVLTKAFCAAAGEHDADTILRKEVPEEAWSNLDDAYNVPQEQLEALWYKNVVKRPFIVRFSGSIKPWVWWRAGGSNEDMSVAALRIWCAAAERTRFACGKVQNEMVPRSFSQGLSNGEKLTVLMSTYNRDTWKHLARHYEAMDIVDHVVIIWHDPAREPPKLKSLGQKTKLWVANTDSLNNRFVLPLSGGSECVYVCDDDMYLSEKTLLKGFLLWQVHARKLVGFFPRKWLMEEPFYTTRVHDGYNIVLTKGLYTHRSYLYAYTHLLPRRITSIVEKHRNCEDILFNMMVTSFTGVPPLQLLVEEPIYDVGHGNGISSRGRHFITRHQCVIDLIRELELTEAPVTPGSMSVRPLKNRERS